MFDNATHRRAGSGVSGDDDDDNAFRLFGHGARDVAAPRRRGGLKREQEAGSGLTVTDEGSVWLLGQTR